LRRGTGIDTYRTCQCKPGYVNDGGECKLGGEGLPLPCLTSANCAGVENVRCDGAEEESEGICRCMAGYIPNLSEDTKTLSACRDPIVATSTVGGLCLGQNHCEFLSGTRCAEIRGTGVRTCQCVEGMVPDSANPVTGIVPRYVDIEYLIMIDSLGNSYTVFPLFAAGQQFNFWGLGCGSNSRAAAIFAT